MIFLRAKSITGGEVLVNLDKVVCVTPINHDGREFVELTVTEGFPGVCLDMTLDDFEGTLRHVLPPVITK